ncbi:AraC family transcriptional regulator [Tenacibaculum sp. Bg11-29]|uniref:helix-turn-helix domain-containing protein n=1 Tax=Tenacibaculum sp. Bg11-29 TaxID=2058306 RepID=UPI000C32A1A3|nr:AraC family transcriptional regulator [Tenacibaculum sp. Bg11-29]PKH52069.1 AraC family transcriptional regulator [Tenacibaculum sp. Bg11-29]
MNYYQQAVNAILKPYIRCFWWLDNDSSKNLNYTILPDGFFDIIVRFDNYKYKSTEITGLYTKEMEVVIPPNHQLFGIQFKLPAVEYIFYESIAPLLNSEKKLPDAFWNLNSFDFSEKSDTIDKLNTIISQEINKEDNLDGRKFHLFRLLSQTKGNQSVSYFADNVFWSSRQINRYFNKMFGLSLKNYCNILRCSASFKDIKKGDLLSNQNYFDRSHFNKEIKKYTNRTPKNISNNENDRFLQISIIPNK